GRQGNTLAGSRIRVSGGRQVNGLCSRTRSYASGSHGCLERGEVRAVDDGEHAMPHVSAFRLAYFPTQRWWRSCIVRDLEKASRHPHGEDIAARGDVVEDLGQQLVLESRVYHGRSSHVSRVLE